MMPEHAHSEQIAVSVDSNGATWHLERTRDGEEATLSVTLTHGSRFVLCEWITWDDAAQDWTSQTVAYQSVQHLIPAKLYS